MEIDNKNEGVDLSLSLSLRQLFELENNPPPNNDIAHASIFSHYFFVTDVTFDRLNNFKKKYIPSDS